MEIKINSHKCPQNHICPLIKICPVNAISQKDPYSLPEIDQKKCIKCKKCTRLCPMKAVEIN